MVVVEGLNKFKNRVSRDNNTRKTDGFRSFKVYTEKDKGKVKTHGRDHVDAESIRKPVPAKAENGHVHASGQKMALNKLENDKRSDNIERKVLADISNFRGNFQKNENCQDSRPGKSKTERMTYSHRASVGTGARNTVSSYSKHLTGKLKGRESQVVGGYRTLGRVNTKDSKVFTNDPRTKSQGQKTVGDVGRESARNLLRPTRKSLPVLKHVDKVDTSDLKKLNLEKRGKSKGNYAFPVKPKVGLKAAPQVSNARNYYWKNQVSDGFRTAEGQPIDDARRLTRRPLKPVGGTTVADPKAQRASKCTSEFSKSRFGTSISSKCKDLSRSAVPKHVPSVSCEQSAQEKLLSDNNSNFKASTSPITTKGRPDRRKSYTSLLLARSKLLKEHGKVTKQEFLPNIYDDCNHLEVAEYVDEIYQYYWVTEAHNQPRINFMEIQTDITPQMRGILVNWLIEVHLKFDLMQETLYLMVTLLDCYLSLVSIKKNEMQLVGLTALLLASKYEDFWHPKIMELISISAEVYARDQMLGMETAMLKELKFRLNVPTPYVFMLRFLRAAQGSKKLESLAFYLTELCLVEYDASKFKPSLLSASAIYVARCTLQLVPVWTPLLCKHSHYEESEIRDCAEMIIKFHQAARTGMLKVSYEKYMSADNCRVASIKPLDRLPPPPPPPSKADTSV